MTSDMSKLSEVEQLDALELWELLFVGEKIQVTFNTAKQAEAFRVRMHQVKSRKEQQLLDIGFLDKNEVQSLLFEKQQSSSSSSSSSSQSSADIEDFLHSYYIYLGKRKRERLQYACRVISSESASSPTLGPKKDEKE